MIRKNIEANIVYVSKGFEAEAQYGYEFSMRDFHFITDDPFKTSNDIDVTFKIRHTPEFIHGKISHTDDMFHLVSNDKLQGIAPGQFGVVYDAESKICIGSGEIF